MSKRVTIHDVAELAEVHKATVSRALNAATQDHVSPETVKRVKRAAQKLGYVPNAMARGLRTNSSMTVGVIIPDLMNPIFPPIIRGIEQHLQPRGYTTLLANTDGHETAETAAFESLLHRRVDGFILATGRLDPQPLLSRAYELGVRVVMVNRETGSAPYPVVTGNNQSGMTAALRHLRELGHRRITHVAGPMTFSTSKVRADAFRSGTAGTRGIRADVVEGRALTVEAGQHAMDEILSSAGSRPTAILAGNDLMALGIIRSLREHGLDCPGDVSVVGFNDMPFAEDFSPPLTTVHVPLREIGAEAAQLLLRMIGSGTLEPVEITLPVSLIVRGSTGPAGVGTHG